MLYVCATPIGNLGDITERVLTVLREADVIAAEDTRQTIKLLNRFSIKNKMVAYHEHNRYEMTPVLVERMLAGEDIALVTDAGTPAISDPGEDLVRACREAGVEVTSLPGATAFTTALTLSGMSARRFTFEGFLPRDKKEQREVLDRLRDTTLTTVFYEAPHRLAKTLGILSEAVEDATETDGEEPGLFQGGRAVTVCKELTKKHEWSGEFQSLREAADYFSENEARGEYVLVVEGADEKALSAREKKRWESLSLSEHMDVYLSAGMDKKEAMKQVAADLGISKREVYQGLLGSKEED